MKRFILLSIILISIAVTAFTQEMASIDTMLLKGKAQLSQAENLWDLNELIAARAYFERLVDDPSYGWLAHYYVGLADSRIVNFCYSKDIKKNEKYKKLAQQYIDDGMNHLEKCIDLKSEFGEAYALLSSLMGNKIGLSPLKAIFLGPKSGKNQNKSFELSPRNPRVHLIAGRNAVYTPKIFGGGLDQAQGHLKRAVALYDSFEVENPVYPTWGHAEAYAYLGLVQSTLKHYDDAKQNYNKALKINPYYGWVRHVLLPDLEKKVAAK